MDVSFPDGDLEYSYEFEIPSLEKLCAMKVISYNLLNEHTSTYLAPSVKRLMMDIAINSANESCIEFLLKHWVEKCLLFPVPEILRTWRKFVLSNLESEPWLVDSVSYILKHFIQTSTALRYVDLSEFQISDLQIVELCDRIEIEMAVHFVDGQDIIVYINCAVSIRETLIRLRLAKLLRPCRVKLVVRRLCMNVGSAEQELCDLLCILDPHELEHFDCIAKLRSLYVNDILEILEDFHCIKSLGLNQDDGKYNLKRLLFHLVNLEQLSISGIDSINTLEHWLSGMYQKQHSCSSRRCSSSSGRKLKALELYCSSYFFSDENLRYLARSPYAETLLHLTLSFSRLQLDSLKHLFQTCNNLRILEILNSAIRRPDISLFEAFLPLNKLICLKFFPEVNTWDKINTNLLSVAKVLAHLPCLLQLHILYPYPDTSTAEKLVEGRRIKDQFVDILRETAPSRFIRVEFFTWRT